MIYLIKNNAFFLSICVYPLICAMNCLFSIISSDDFGTLCRFLYPYNAMCIIYCVKNGKLSRRCNTQTCTRDALLAYSRMRVALSRSPFIAFNKAQRTGLFYIAVSWTAVEYCRVPLSLEQIKFRIEWSRNYGVLSILIKILSPYFTI